MRPRKFGVKPSNALKLRRTSRPNKHISVLSNFFYGSETEKARQVADYVLHQIPVNEQINVLEKKRLFRTRAVDSVKSKTPVGVFHCAERSNLAISLLNEAGVKSWLARVIYPIDKSWRFHDYVEFSSGGKVHTLTFVNYGRGVPDTAVLYDHPAEKMFPLKTPFIFRGADSKQIGGVATWNEFLKFAKKVESNPNLQVAKNQARINLLVKEGIIPQSAVNEFKSH